MCVYIKYCYVKLARGRKKGKKKKRKKKETRSTMETQAKFRLDFPLLPFLPLPPFDRTSTTSSNDPRSQKCRGIVDRDSFDPSIFFASWTTGVNVFFFLFFFFFLLFIFFVHIHYCRIYLSNKELATRDTISLRKCFHDHRPPLLLLLPVSNPVVFESNRIGYIFLLLLLLLVFFFFFFPRKSNTTV